MFVFKKKQKKFSAKAFSNRFPRLDMDGKCDTLVSG